MKPNTRKEAFLMKHMGFDVETPEPATREEMIMANAPVGGASGGCGWVERKEVTVECKADAEENLLEGFPAFAVGGTVTVKVDGVEYSLVAFDDGIPVVGDSSEAIGSGNLKYGWAIACIPDGSVAFAALENHVVSYVVDVVHKIDGKFMPEGYPYSTEVMVEETRYFEPTSSDGGYVDDLGFAQLLRGNLDKATYTYNGKASVIDQVSDTSCILYRYDGNTNQYSVELVTDSNGNLTGRVWFGDDVFANGSITIKAAKEVVHPIDSKFMPLLTDANGVKYKLTVSTSGALSAVKVDE